MSLLWHGTYALPPCHGPPCHSDIAQRLITFFRPAMGLTRLEAAHRHYTFFRYRQTLSGEFPALGAAPERRSLPATTVILRKSPASASVQGWELPNSDWLGTAVLVLSPLASQPCRMPAVLSSLPALLPRKAKSSRLRFRRAGNSVARGTILSRVLASLWRYWKARLALAAVLRHGPIPR